MCGSVLYLKSHGRRPVWVSLWPQPDRQGAIPWGWCEECGKEVFTPGQLLCGSCLELDGRGSGSAGKEAADRELFEDTGPLCAL